MSQICTEIWRLEVARVNEETLIFDNTDPEAEVWVLSHFKLMFVSTLHRQEITVGKIGEKHPRESQQSATSRYRPPIGNNHESDSHRNFATGGC